MDAKELMIGDWVLWKNKPVQVASVSGVKYSFGQIDVTLAHCNDKELLEKHDIKSIQPIPLTTEILEKNGFNIEIAPYTPDWKRCILNPNFFLEDRLEGFYHFNGNNLAKIQYVHELQHALRLCRIEKNIEP